jgi:multidrug transporter EmrE-like cation transporter
MLKYTIALLIALVLNASANLLIKFGMRSLGAELAGAPLLDDGLIGMLRLLLRNWPLLLGLGCFALNVVFYAYALQRMPISIAYPVMVATGFAIIVTVAGWKLGESLTLAQWVGVAAILGGVALVAKDAGKQMGGAATASPVADNDAAGQ